MYNNKSLQASILDGIFFSLMFAFGESFISAYAVFLKLSAFKIALLASFPLVIGSLSQLLGVYLMDKGIKRKKIILTGVIFQTFVWLAIGSLNLFDISANTSGILLILFVTFYFIMGFLVNPVWTSLIGDLVPVDKRGNFFGHRNRLGGAVVLAGLLSSGLFLENSTEANKGNVFLTLFSLAFIARCISAYFLSKHEDSEYVADKKDYFTFIQFLKRIPHSNFGKFVCFHACMHFCMFLYGPFLVIYMLEELSFGYFQYSIIISSALLANIFVMLFWGSFGDRFGNKKILSICSTGIVIVPTLWAFNTSLWFLVIVQILTGFFWSGFQLGASNFLLDAVTREKRARCTAYLWLPTTIAMCAGSIIGSALLKYPKFLSFFTLNLSSSVFVGLFIFSGLARALVTLIFLPMFKEVRDVEILPSIFRLAHVHPVMGSSIRLAKINLKKKKLKIIKNNRLKK